VNSFAGTACCCDCESGKCCSTGLRGGSKKTRPLCFTACNFGSIDHIGRQWHFISKVDCNRLRSARMSEFRKTSNLWRSSSAVMKVFWTFTEIRTKLERRRDITLSSIRRIAMDVIFGWKSTSACQGYCHSIDGATLFPRLVQINYEDVKLEWTLICAKIGADLVNTSKVTSRKNRWPRFLSHPVVGL